MTPIRFVEALRELSLENTFNPYSERCVRYDRNDAPQLRRATLRSMLEAAAKREIDFLWIGRDPGHRGGRRTGLAFTDDVHLHEHAERWGLSIRRPTRGEKVSEQTATVIWRALSRIESSGLPVECLPPASAQTRKPPSATGPTPLDERRIGEEFLDELIRLLRPRRLVAIGNDAAKTARRLGDRRTVIQVRHPSHGGQTEVSNPDRRAAPVA